jgi:tetratricopeptide (TPR) repeat protein
MNHDWLVQYVGVDAARGVYEALEPFMQWDYHYWLQRGSYELEHGEYQHAENFLNQAYGLNPDDPLVKTEYAYLTLRRAQFENIPREAREALGEGFALLKEAIEDRHGSDPHQYHIYGKEGLNWLLRSDVTPQERKDLLDDLQNVVLEGIQAHHSDERLRQLLVEVQNAQLGHIASFSGQTPTEGTPVVQIGEERKARKSH